jgi:hypothetical protein
MKTRKAMLTNPFAWIMSVAVAFLLIAPAKVVAQAGGASSLPAPTLVQVACDKNTFATSGSTVTCSTSTYGAANPVQGHTLIMVAGTQTSGTIATYSISDTLGLQWQPYSIQPGFCADVPIMIATAYVTTGGADSITVTLTSGNPAGGGEGNGGAILIIEVAGAPIGAPLDDVNADGACGGWDTTYASGSVTTTNPTDLLIDFTAPYGYTVTESSLSNGYTIYHQSAGDDDFLAATRTTTAAGTFSTTWTWSGGAGASGIHIAVR